VMLALAAWLPWIFTDPSLEGEPVTAGQVFAHVGYLQNILGFDNISVGFWTLCIEVQFYLAFVTALGFAPWLAARWGRREQRVDLRPLAWAMLPVALMSLFVFSRDPASDAWLVHYFGYFYFGILAAWVLDDRIPARLFWAFATAMALRLGLFGGLDVAVGLASGVAIHLAGRLGKLDAWLTAGWLQRIGRNSYSLYLIHYPVSCLVTAFGLWLTGTQPGYAVLWVLAALAVSMAAAEGLYHLVERPSLELSQRLGTLRPSSRPTPTSVSQFPRPANT